MDNKYGLLTKPSVKMTRYWPSSFLRFHGPNRSRGQKKKNAKKRTIFSHLDRPGLVNKGFIIWSKREYFFLWEQRGKSRARSGSQSELRIRLISRSQPFNK